MGWVHKSWNLSRNLLDDLTRVMAESAYIHVIPPSLGYTAVTRVYDRTLQTTYSDHGWVGPHVLDGLPELHVDRRAVLAIDNHLERLGARHVFLEKIPVIVFAWPGGRCLKQNQYIKDGTSAH